MRDVGEGAIAVVVIEGVHARLETPRPAHYVNPLPLTPAALSRPRHGVVAELDIARYDNICLTVAVVIDKTATGAPLVLRGLDAGLGGHIGKCPIPVVAIEHILSPIRDEQIEVAVIVVVADAPSLPPARARQSGMRCDIGKRPVMVVVIKVWGRSFVLGKSFNRRAVGKVNVRPSVVVVIENDGAVTGGLDDEFFMSVAAVYVEGAQAGLLCDVLEMNFARLDFRCLRLGGLRSLGCEP